MDRPLRCSHRDCLVQSRCNGIVGDGARLARDIGLKILQDALEASETGFRELGFLMLHRDRSQTERQCPAQLLLKVLLRDNKVGAARIRSLLFRRTYHLRHFAGPPLRMESLRDRRGRCCLRSVHCIRRT